MTVGDAYLAEAPPRRAAPQVSRSPVEAVTEEAAGFNRARCSDCAAELADVGVDAAWMWLETHLCGTETISLH